MTEWLALLRVHEGGVTRQGGCYLNYGRAMATYVAEAVDELLGAGVLVLGPVTVYGQRRVLVTVAAQARYAELCESHSEGRRRADG